MFDINSLYNPQNKRIWAVNCGEVDGKGGVKQKQKISQKVMVWLGRNNTIGHLGKRNSQPQSLYQKFLPVAHIYNNQVFGDNWMFQQDSATPHINHLSQKWCTDNFLVVINQKQLAAKLSGP